MADEQNPGAGAAGAGSNGNGAGGGAAAPDLSKMSDTEALDSTIGQPLESVGEGLGSKEAVPSGEKPAEGAKEAGAEEEINLAALEEGTPEWLAKVTDPAVKTEVQKLLDLQKAFSARFKDAEDLESFFGELPGGREQITALQTLSKEVAELDTHIEANTPESNAIVVGRYLGEAPDGGVGLFRAGAQHLAKTNPQAWNEIGNELVASSLKTQGIAADLPTVISAVNEMRQAMQNDDGEAFGKAAGKLLGTPQREAAADPRLTEAQQRETAARGEAQKAQGEVYKSRSQQSGQNIDKHFGAQITPLLDKALPKSIPAAMRQDLQGKIGAEIKAQLQANAYLVSQLAQLIGPDGNPRLTATEADWKAAGDIITRATTPDLVKRAAKTVLEPWSAKFVADSNNKIAVAKGGAARKDVSGGSRTSNVRKPLTLGDLEGPNAKTDREILDSVI